MSQGLSCPDLSFVILRHPSTISPPFWYLLSLAPPFPPTQKTFLDHSHSSLKPCTAQLLLLRKVSVCLVWGQSCVLPPQASSTCAAGPQIGSGGGPIGFLSHCVSHSLCGPLQASWAVGDTPALGARLRWKPSSVPTLLGKSPPLLGCTGWG